MTSRAIDLTGQIYGYLTVLKRDYTKKHQRSAMWLCKCICGKEVVVSARSLRSGNTKSCGCAHGKNFVGKKFGMLTVIRNSNQRTPHGNIIWECKCDCGNICYIPANYLQQGTSSCGCNKHMSIGEITIKNLLDAHNCSYEQEKTFDSCRNPATNYLLRFDFYVNNSYLIEFDGRQHFQNIAGWSDKEKNIIRDTIKNQWCQTNNIPLIRIPYTYLKNLIQEDLDLTTSNFREV